MRFGVVAFGAEDESLDEAIEYLLQALRVVFSVHDVTVIFRIELSLRAQFAAEKFGGV